MEINKYEIKDTQKYGKGIFAKENISKGTCIWEFKLNQNVFEFDKTEFKNILDKLPTLQMRQDYIGYSYSFGFSENFYIITDDGIYMNHSNKNNCETDTITGNVYAITDIKKGEQLFENYTNYYHSAYLFELYEKYNCYPDFYVFSKYKNK